MDVAQRIMIAATLILLGLNLILANADVRALQSRVSQLEQDARTCRYCGETHVCLNP